MAERDDRREAVLGALAEQPGRPVSGERLAGALGCSRAAVHRHVEALRRRGVPIEGAGGGYVLDPEADLVVPGQVERRLSRPLEGPVEWSAETGSTNDDAAARARAGAEEGLVVGADRQRAGRGRRGRPWLSPPGDSLLVSFVLRPPLAPVDAVTLPLLVALGAAEACGEDAAIAWPNDILIGGRKVAGVLVELSADHERVAWAVAGIGINVRDAPRMPDARWEPGALGAGWRRADVLVALADGLGRRYARWCRDGPEAALAEYAERDALRGRMVIVSTDQGSLSGVAAGVDDLGRLRLRGERGEELVSVGEVTGVEPDEGRSSAGAAR